MVIYMQILFEGDKESNKQGKVILLQLLCKDEIHFICHTSQKRRGASSFSIPFTPKIASLNPYTLCTKLKYQCCSMFTNMIRVKHDNNNFITNFLL